MTMERSRALMMIRTSNSSVASQEVMRLLLDKIEDSLDMNLWDLTYLAGGWKVEVDDNLGRWLRTGCWIFPDNIVRDLSSDPVEKLADDMFEQMKYTIYKHKNPRCILIF